MKHLRIYVDTSVIGGCFDAQYAADSQALIQMALDGRATLIVSDLLLLELHRAPEPVRNYFDSLPTSILERFPANQDADQLHRAYLAAGVVGPASRDDALHVANATVARADMIVSWNFRHIVHSQKIQGYNAVNLREGYGLLAIYTPTQVI